MKRIEKVKNYVKKHKKAFIAGGILVTTGVISFVVLKKRPAKGSSNAILHIMRTDDGSALSEATRVIDEEIFTELAPEIEELVLNEEEDHKIIEKYFDLGKDRLFKHVKVEITQYAGD